MRSIARRLKSEKGLGLIIVDYLQLMVPTQTKNDNLVQQVTEISHSLKNLARELDVPVLALSPSPAQPQHGRQRPLSATSNMKSPISVLILLAQPSRSLNRQKQFSVSPRPQPEESRRLAPRICENVTVSRNRWRVGYGFPSWRCQRRCRLDHVAARRQRPGKERRVSAQGDFQPRLGQREESDVLDDERGVG